MNMTTTNAAKKNPTPGVSDSAYSHHEFRLDMRNLTRGQLIESYVELKAQRDELQRELSDTRLALIAQRFRIGDELLAAAKECAVAIADQKRDGLDRQNWICDMLSTAIARVKGDATYRAHEL
jgi:hypothetical protein